MTPKEIVLQALTALFINFDAEAAAPLLAGDYIQHNPNVPTGAEPLLGYLPALKESGLSADVHRVLAEDDLVVIHSTYKNAQAFGAETLVAFDVFRVKNGRIAEHWDNLQPLPERTASGRSMVDGPTVITDTEKTAQNKAIIQGFLDDVLYGAAPEKITNYISRDSYAQHNPLVEDGLSGLGAALEAMAASGNEMVYEKTHLLVAEGNFVFAASEGRLGETPMAFFDLFRIEQGKIVEHWDTVSQIPTEMAHGNGKF